jgi:multidrug efflux pump subunit AcrA (membrane-fusion protein)
MPACSFGDIKSLEKINFSRPINGKGKRRKRRIQGKVKEVLVKEGQDVHKGTHLIILTFLRT